MAWLAVRCTAAASNEILWPVEGLAEGTTCVLVSLASGRGPQIREKHIHVRLPSQLRPSHAQGVCGV